jgi:amino acid transporter
MNNCPVEAARTKLALGRPVAAINAVFYWVSNPIWLGGALTITAITTFEAFFFELGDVGKYAFGLGLVWASVLSAVLSFRIGKWIAIFGACARVAVLVVFTFSVILYGAQHGVHGVRLPQFAPSYDGFIAVVPLLFFNFVGFELPSAAGEEMVDPKRDVPFAVMRAALAAVLCYGIPVLAILLVLPTDRITGLKGFVDAMAGVRPLAGASCPFELKPLLASGPSTIGLGAPKSRRPIRTTFPCGCASRVIGGKSRARSKRPTRASDAVMPTSGSRWKRHSIA